MQEEDYIKDDEIWCPDDCEIQDESGLDFEGIQQSLKLNKDIERIMSISKRNWILDPILIEDELNGFKRYMREELYYLKIDMQQHAKGVIKGIYGRARRLFKR